MASKCSSTMPDEIRHDFTTYFLLANFAEKCDFMTVC